MQHAMNYSRLERENRAFRGTGGVSQKNCSSGFLPAFQDQATGRIDLARFADGRPAPCHLLDGALPEWVGERDGRGRVVALKGSVVSGFFRNGCFYTRRQAAGMV